MKIKQKRLSNDSRFCFYHAIHLKKPAFNKEKRVIAQEAVRKTKPNFTFPVNSLVNLKHFGDLEYSPIFTDK